MICNEIIDDQSPLRVPFFKYNFFVARIERILSRRRSGGLAEGRDRRSGVVFVERASGRVSRAPVREHRAIVSRS